MKDPVPKAMHSSNAAITNTDVCIYSAHIHFSELSPSVQHLLHASVHFFLRAQKYVCQITINYGNQNTFLPTQESVGVHCRYYKCHGIGDGK